MTTITPTQLTYLYGAIILSGFMNVILTTIIIILKYGSRNNINSPTNVSQREYTGTEYDLEIEVPTHFRYISKQGIR